MKDKRNIYSVSQVNSYIRRMFDDDFILRNIYIKGELSNLKYHSSGHVYFSLKDDRGVISAVMWRSDAANLKFRLEDGMQVIIHGSVSIYEAGGKYQIYAKTIEDAGKGDLAAKFEALKQKLSEMGMFSSEYKKPIPAYSLKIGVVTAETGAVIRDIYNVASRRNPYCQILLFPSQVQGEGAAEQIARGIEVLSKADVDTIIIGRGGGSMEDLWAFNEEVVARAIFNCEKPVISAVGHETDFTIADFVADLRAPTPSAAAELAVFDYYQFEKDLSDWKYTLKLHMDRKLDLCRHNVKNYGLKMETLSPANQLMQKKQLLSEKADKVSSLFSDKLNAAKQRNAIQAERLSGLSPLKRLSEGYAYAQDSEGKALKSIRQVLKGEVIRIHVTDGKIEAEIKEIQEVSHE